MSEKIVTQPPSDSPYTDRRTDINTRAVVDALNRKLEEKLLEHDKKIESSLKPYVTYAVLAGLLTGLFGTGALIVSAVLTPTKEAVSSVISKVEKMEGSVTTKLEKMEDKVSELKISAAKSEAVYSVVVQQRSRAEAKAQVQQVQRAVDKEKEK